MDAEVVEPVLVRIDIAERDQTVEVGHGPCRMATVGPTGYLNGSALVNVTGFVHHCNLTGQACVDEDGGKSPDSFLWYDELHPRHVDWHFRSARKLCANADAL